MNGGEYLCHDFEDDFAHLVWCADFWLVRISAVLVPLYTQTHRLAVGILRDTWNC